MNRKVFLTATLLCLVLSSFVTAAHASVGISEVNPSEGTVGTKVIILGVGFGQKQGEVLIGIEKCKILDWSDSQITCEVVKPQLPGEYTVTVLLQGGRKSAEPMTFAGFTMHEPQIIPAETPSGFISDGKEVTILGDFFGDKRGQVFVVGPNGASVEAKVVDWSMKSVRFEIPRTLSGATGKYVIKVENEIGDALRFVQIDSGMPQQMQDYAYIGTGSDKCPSGVEYKDKFYLFHTHTYCACIDSKRIQLQMVDFGRGTETTVSPGPAIPKGESNASVVPLVIEDKMWVFHTGRGGQIWYDSFDGTAWTYSGWQQIPGASTSSDWEIAVVYNPVRQWIEVYYEHDRKLYWLYSDDYGANWSPGGELTAVGTISTPPGAVFYKKSDTNYRTLLAVGDATNQGHVYDIVYDANGQPTVQLPARLSFGAVWGRPFIYEPVPVHNEIHLIWLEAADSDVHWKGMYKWRNDEWGPTYIEGCYYPSKDWCWKSHWPPTLAAWVPEQGGGWWEAQIWGYGTHYAINWVGLPMQP